ncbi:YihY/virulence factor BrkB family protein [Raineya orbicola]|jgi:membrane protein|uniref:YihY family inner membrane protein n=1 Tax=Raineya orbicola TaxID=2016530 RepID=A0A2N3IKP0_9BACT|nr:YihY/virulence factor BrkB family protein [Raineya orbicola]PKQ70895.1 YihY family inner membrane protein [Raineya orbicola]
MFQSFLRKYVVSKKWFIRLDNWLSTWHIGSSIQVPFYTFGKILLKNLLNNDLHIRASSVAFSLTLSLFPFLLFLLTLIPYTPLDYQQVMSFARYNIPKEIFHFVETTISDILSNKRTDLLSVSFLFTLYTATNGMSALIESFNKTFLYAEKRSFWQQRLIALYLTGIISFTFLFAVVILIGSRFALKALLKWGFLNDDFLWWLLVISKYIIAFSVFFFVISLIYYIAPASHDRWRFISIGSIFTSISAILTTNLFSFYLENFASYNKLYGSIGTLIALMLWIYLLSFLLILGFELNASWLEAKKTTYDFQKIE